MPAYGGTLAATQIVKELWRRCHPRRRIPRRAAASPDRRRRAEWKREVDPFARARRPRRAGFRARHAPPLRSLGSLPRARARAAGPLGRASVTPGAVRDPRSARRRVLPRRANERPRLLRARAPRAVRAPDAERDCRRL